MRALGCWASTLEATNDTGEFQEQLVLQEIYTPPKLSGIQKQSYLNQIYFHNIFSYAYVWVFEILSAIQVCYFFSQNLVLSF